MTALLTPCDLGPLNLRNRIVYLPFFTAYADEEGYVTPQIFEHYRRMAESGVGMVVVEASLVRERYLAPASLRAFGESHMPGLQALVQGIHSQGAKAVMQIVHPGRFSGVPGVLAPSAIPAFGDEALTPREMNEKDMMNVAVAFAEAADTVRRAGFDGVELHGATGYLLSSFTSPRTNQRTDIYGGTIENRMRFPLEVCRTVRDVVGDFPVGYRLMAREYLPGGLSLEEGMILAQAIEQELEPAYLSVTAGTHECFAMLAEDEQKTSKGFMLPEADAVKRAVARTAVIAAGQLQDQSICDYALNQGIADAVGLGRVLFADPDWVHKIAGQDINPIRNCVQCNNCQKQISEGKPAFCIRWSKKERAFNLRNLPQAEPNPA